MKRSILVAGLFSVTTLAACGLEGVEGESLEADEAGLLASTPSLSPRVTALSPKLTLAQRAALAEERLQAAIHDVLGSRLPYVAASDDDDGGGDTGGGGSGGGDDGGGSGGGSSGGGAQCSDQSEGDNCTECQVGGQTCECCGWTECWEEDDVCVCSIEIEDVNCDGGDLGGGGQIFETVGP